MSTKSNKNTTGKGAAKLLAVLLVIGFLIYVAAAGLGKNRSGSVNDIKLGLDLAGGVSITYQAVGEEPTSTDMADTVYKLQLRAQNYSNEAEVYQEGSNRINVDIPGVSDANEILQELGKPGSLTFQDQSGNVLLTGMDVQSAEAGIMGESNNREYVVSLTFTEEGAAKFAEATTERVGQIIYIIYDNEVVSNPVVRTAITGGQCSIEGMASYEEADILASTIRIGALPVELEEIRSNVVGAKLGQEAISTSLMAGAIGLGLVMLFMIITYGVPGVAASLALALYTSLIIFLLSVYKITLTLPGIAGIILSIGMAVDANVIIFARIREEMAAGKSVRSSMKDGFKKALSAIVDGNITTLIAAFVLWWRGSGTVRGFAQTLALGVVLSMFTALVITRVILGALYEVGLTDSRLYGYNPAKPKKEQKTIDFLGKKHICFILSLAVIAVGLVFMGINSGNGKGILNYSLEFKGGTSTSVTFNEDMTLEQIQSEVVPVVAQVTGDQDIQTQKVSGGNEVLIKTRTLSVEERQQLDQLLADNFGVDQELITAESISATVSSEMKQDAVIAVIIATIAMLLYIWLRFKDIRFASGAVLALLHDVLVVLTCYAALRWTVGNTFIACMLTIVGYSINATIVIFDRIRENLKTPKLYGDLKELVNGSITQTLTRTIYTSFTTFITIFVLWLVGVTAIKEFALPLIVGIVCGGYSSVCITGALWYLMKKKSYEGEK